MKDYNKITDIELIEMLKQGNSSAFETLINRYKRKVATTISAMVGNSADVDDIGQETFIRFYQSLSSFRGDSSISTYLTRIAINLSINVLNKKKRHLFISFFKNQFGEEEIEIEDSYNFQLDSEFKEIIHFALKKLNLSLRSVIVLRLIDGYSVKETAEILKIPQGTVLSRQSRGQEKLKIILKDYSF